MHLRSLQIENLHGTLNLSVDFNEDVTLLVGINGSGKTSVLNVIDWLLRPDLKRLALATYARLDLVFEWQGRVYSLEAKKTTAILTLSLDAPGVTPAPIEVKLHKNLDPNDEEAAGIHYDNLGPEKHEVPMWEMLKSFSKPTVITLDRTVSAEVDEVIYVENSRGGMQRRVRARSPLAHVKEVTSTRFAEYREKAIQHDNELKARIVMSALQDPEVIFQGGTVKPMSGTEIDQLEGKVVKYLSGTIKSDDVATQVRRFFSSSRMLARRPYATTDRGNPLVDFVFSQYRQVENLAKAFNDFEIKNASAFRGLSDYLVAVNQFFEDSKKSLRFDESTGQLVFDFVDASSPNGQRRPLDHLSSGEKQVLILLTFLAFVAKPGSVFIVDEPELSLHPKWQHEFMEVFLQLRPPRTQLLLATHSPDIVGRFKGACVTLRGRNNG